MDDLDLDQTSDADVDDAEYGEIKDEDDAEHEEMANPFNEIYASQTLFDDVHLDTTSGMYRGLGDDDQF